MSADKNDNDRNELLNNGRPSYWQGDSINDDDDDDDEPIADFRPKPSSSYQPTVDDLRKQQNRILEDQNEGLEALSQVISRQKHLALRIGDEFDDQNGGFFFCFHFKSVHVDHVEPCRTNSNVECMYFQLLLISSPTQWIQPMPD